jgi:hypothetical protein
MNPVETSKQRAARVPAGHYRRWDWNTRWKLALAAAALLAAGGWWAWGFTRPDAGRSRYSHGPVAAVHAAWESDCEACHEPFRPVNGNTWLADWTAGRGALPGGAANRCDHCHGGPPHHATAVGEPTCGACHRDHRGRDTSLVRLPDADCTGCHADLPAHRRGGTEGLPFHPAVASFAADHPPFQLPRQPGQRTFKFSHQLHLAAGLGADLTAEKLGRLGGPDAVRRYAPGPDSAVQLTCASCHQPDGGPGAYMRPVAYEQHCQGCHPLRFDKDLPPAPHRLQPAQLAAYLTEVYSAAVVSGRPDLVLKEPRPRARLDRPEIEQARPARELVGRQVRDAQLALYGHPGAPGRSGCAECHDPAPGHRDFREPGATITADSPAVWFRHARFNHAAHQALDCRGCHATAYPAAGEPPPFPPNVVEKEPIHLPDIANCRACHAPASAINESPVGGARHDCTECHTYHGGDAPERGVGAPGRGPGRTWETSADFLRGTRAP